MDDSDADQRLLHHKEPKEFVSLDQLAGKLLAACVGYVKLQFLSWRLDADNPDTDPELKKIREELGYTYMDVCEVCPRKLPNCEEKIKSFFLEHLNTDQEIRYCVAGSALRFFVREPVWTPYNRPHDHLAARQKYVKAFVEMDVANHAVDAAAYDLVLPDGSSLLSEKN